MASNFHIQEPYVLTTLPAPLERLNGPGRYSVGEVFGQQPGSKKRKRAELSVGIDGDAANLYDVASNNLITSYPIPPQSFFTCPPYSLRWKARAGKDLTRYTYISTQDTLSSKKQIVLFKDVLGASGDTTSTSVAHTHTYSSPIIYLSSIKTNPTAEAVSDKQPSSSIIAITEEGTITCFYAETLKQRWTVGSSVLLRGLPSSSSQGKVEFVQATTAADAIDGIFQGKDDSFGIFPQKVHRDGFNPDILVVVNCVEQARSRTPQRYLQILAFTPENGSQNAGQASVLPVFATPIPAQNETKDKSPELRFDIRSGSLQKLTGETLYSYSLTGGSVRLESTLEIPNVVSFLRLSKTSVLACTSSSLDVYNPVYRSIQASTPINPADQATDHSLPYRREDQYRLFSYFASREIAVGVRGSALIAVQVEPPKTRSIKRRGEGLLIDSIGRGISRAQVAVKQGSEDQIESLFANQLPGTLSDSYWAEWQEEVAKADALLSAQRIAEFEQLLASKFGVQLAETKDKTNGKVPSDAKPLPEWLWPSSRAEYPRVDRRWVLYAISKAFAWDESAGGEPGATHLTCQISEGGLVSYLADAGHLTVANITSAFREETRDLEQAELVVAEELPQLVASIDPTLELLASFLSATKLGPAELLSSVRLIIRSLDLVQDPTKLQGLIANGENGADETDLISMELDRAEQELKMTEFYVNDTSTRARGLGVAFSKLGACAAPATVKSMRRLLKPEEMLCLVNILRMELVKDGWTTRYLDAPQPENEEGEAPPDGSIQLIADLLCRCIDAIGSAGFLTNNALFTAMTSHVDMAEFFQQFKAEISVALEGIEEAVRLRGILTEVVKYGASLQKLQPHARGKGVAIAAKPKQPALDAFPADGRMLPLGLRASAPRISQEKIISGGEIVQRSKRETAMLVRKNLGPYIIEKVGPKH
ncbi:hypothetical protein GQ53DRAFT_802458 [Thozetella sp. PMI_491]|nr:hypothetical protein GQ53DRAFT_802458 [Thozetella sp. PMI_491]